VTFLFQLSGVQIDLITYLLTGSGSVGECGWLSQSSCCWVHYTIVTLGDVVALGDVVTLLLEHRTCHLQVVGLVESNDSLPPSLWLMSPVGWRPRNRDQLRAQRS